MVALGVLPIDRRLGDRGNMLSIDNLKIILAVFTALLIVLLINNVLNEVFHTEPLEENAYQVAVAEGPAEETPAAAEEEPALEPIAPLLASADPAAGQSASKRCATCHTFDQGGANRVGPNLWGVVGRDKGSVDGYDYSSAMAEADGAWDYEALNAFLADPKGFVQGTKMNFAGIRKAQDRADLIVFLREQSSNPPPLP